jgi:hypothetical protein
MYPLIPGGGFVGGIAASLPMEGALVVVSAETGPEVGVTVGVEKARGVGVLCLVSGAEHGGIQAGASAAALGPAVDTGGLRLIAVSGALVPSLWAPLKWGSGRSHAWSRGRGNEADG